jgi:hypothetical protein
MEFSYVSGKLDLQRTLATGSATTCNPQVSPHHPIVCDGHLWYHEDGRFECEHAQVDATDDRTQRCLDHTVALMLFEALRRLDVG